VGVIHDPVLETSAGLFNWTRYNKFRTLPVVTLEA